LNKLNGKNRVLIVLPNSLLGGAEQFLQMIAELFKNDNVDILFSKQIETNGWNAQKKYANILTPKSNFLLSRIFFLIGYIFKNGPYDYVFTSHVYITGFLGVLRKINILKTSFFIGRESTSIFLRFTGVKLLSYKLAYILGYGQVDLLICQTEKMKHQLLTGLPSMQKKTKIRVMHNPINLEKIEKLARDSADVNLPSKYLVSAGRLIPEKGFDLLIRSLANLNQKDLHLIILGEGPHKEKLIELSGELNVNRQVIFKGFVDNVYPYFKNAACCVVSSRIEGFPNVLLQMMSQNPNVVSTLCAGGIENIPGIYTAQTNKVKSLEKAIDSCLSSSNNGNKNEIFDSFLQKNDVKFFKSKMMKELI